MAEQARVVDKNMWKVAIAVVAASIAFGSALYVGLHSLVIGRQAACTAEHKDTQTLDNLLIFFEGRTLQSKQITAQQRQLVIKFYADARKHLPSTTGNC